MHIKHFGTVFIIKTLLLIAGYMFIGYTSKATENIVVENANIAIGKIDALEKVYRIYWHRRHINSTFSKNSRYTFCRFCRRPYNTRRNCALKTYEDLRGAGQITIAEEKPQSLRRD